MSRIVCLHGVPKGIVSDRGTQFTSKFWHQLHETLGTRLEFSTAFHPQTDGQTERVNQILEDMLTACALDYGSTWDENLPYAEFSYNNSYQSSIEMAPFEALYGRKCRTPLLWDGVGERSLFGPDLIKEAEEKVRLIRDRLKIAQSGQKSYADSRRREVTYEVGDRAYLRVSPLRGVKRFGIKGKLAPRFIGPYKILARKGEVAYQLESPRPITEVAPSRPREARPPWLRGGLLLGAGLDEIFIHGRKGKKETERAKSGGLHGCTVGRRRGIRKLIESKSKREEEDS
jgi:hypothetical protein